MSGIYSHGSLLLNSGITLEPYRLADFNLYGVLVYLSFAMLFLALILRIITLAERNHSTFARVYAYCVASYLIFHLTINIGMVIGLCPVIGIPLPFFSYGGSSLLGFTVLLFILLRLDADRGAYGSW